VRFFSGIPACVYPGTQYPLALYFAPIAVGVSMVTVPVGFLVGQNFAQVFAKEKVEAINPQLVWISAHALTLVSFAMMVILRIL